VDDVALSLSRKPRQNNRIAQDHDWVVARHIERNELDSRRRDVRDHAACTRYDDRAITSARKDARKLNGTSVGGTDGSHPISVTGAFAAVAETGTIALTSGAPSPTLLNFLPETHIVVVDAKDLSGTYEELWTRLKAQYGETMPRTLNLVTGPSRSGDIEQTILMGAHGPKRLHIIVVDEP